jgi:hypothetical protein
VILVILRESCNKHEARTGEKRVTIALVEIGEILVEGAHGSIVVRLAGLEIKLLFGQRWGYLSIAR